MSNEIKNTLFRFVSMRAPELTGDYETKPGFIVQKSNDKGHFNTAIEDLEEGTSKAEALKAAANDYQPLSTEQLKSLNKELYEFSVWLAKNRQKASAQEIKERIDTISNSIDLKIVWENIFYQIISQDDFYAKEIAMQLLLANHVAVTKPEEMSFLKEKALAKIVLPKALFSQDNASRVSLERIKMPTGKSKETLFASTTMQALEKQVQSKEQIQALTLLKKELLSAEKQYTKMREVEYNKKYLAYQAEVKPILDNYNKDLDDARKAWCSIKDPNIPYDANDPCQQPPSIPQPELPNFEFSYIDELDDEFLREKLSNESFALYQELIKPEFLGEANRLAQPFINNVVETFQDVNELIDQMVDFNNDTISQNTIETGNTTVIIPGGVPVTVPIQQSPLQPYQYEIKTRNKSLLNDGLRVLQILLGIPDTTWKVAAVQYKMTKLDDTFVQKSSTNVTHFNGFDAMLSLSMDTITANLKELYVQFQFENGETASVTIPSFVLVSTYKGFVNLSLNESSQLPDETNPGDTSTINPDTAFIPSGFGVKQIGIADYNKVEQTIQGYIEGEVAHIENIMAREFKEKSTRRLRKREVTESTSSETEKEQLTDTSTVDRFEMQNEVAKVIASSKDFSAGAYVNAQYGAGDNSIQLGANANMATHNSKEESTRQALTNAKEITERALDRMVTKVKEERIEKIVEEFEENNSHGFDNRKGDKHVVGVYRWVDKVFKNQIVNYGKRLMFEFSVPEPAKLHKLAMQTLAENYNATALTEPQDPRKATTNKLENFAQLDDAKLKYWTGKYNVEFEPKPKQYIYVGESFNINITGGAKLDHTESNSGNGKIMIPEGYKTTRAKGVFNASSDNDLQGNILSLTIGSATSTYTSRFHRYSLTFDQSMTDFVNEVPVSYTLGNHVSGDISASVKCELTPEFETKWQQETFNAIIKAYENALAEYKEALAQHEAQGVQILGTNPGFYREIENTILRKNCISYLLDNNPTAKRTFGREFYTKNNNASTLTFGNAVVNQNTDLDDYASFVKFMEQAFEWDIMSYYFYPHYWANREKWMEMYQYNQTHDHLFKAFMQSGMARVVVTVRPGFEEAVRYYMQTGQIWNGGEVPVIGDELFLSIVDELRAPESEKLGKAWPTRVPTSMTILQAQSIGLKVDKALPYNDDLSDFENPDEVPQSEQFVLSEAQIGVSNEEGIRHIENIDINDGYLQLTTDDSPRQLVAQISLQAIKNALDESTN